MREERMMNKTYTKSDTLRRSNNNSRLSLFPFTDMQQLKEFDPLSIINIVARADNEELTLSDIQEFVSMTYGTLKSKETSLRIQQEESPDLTNWFKQDAERLATQFAYICLVFTRTVILLSS